MSQLVKKIPTKFQETILTLYKAEGENWLSSLPELISDLSQKWNLHSLEISPNLSYNLVLFGRRNNRPIVLKIGCDEEILSYEAKALIAFQGKGVVDLLHHTKNAMLLKRCLPGNSLKTFFPDQEANATEIFCGVLKNLHQAPFPQDHSFSHISDWLKALDKGWAIPKEYLKQSRILRDELLKTSSPDILLHGDLHHDNILFDGHDFVAIDPRGVIGDPHFDVGAYCRNPIPDLMHDCNRKEIISKRIDAISKIFDFEKKRITQWCFVQAVLSWCWALDDQLDFSIFSKTTLMYYELLEEKVFL